MVLRRLSCCVLLSLTAGCAFTPAAMTRGTEAKQAPALSLDQVLDIDPAVRTGRLDNGLRYIVRGNAKPENRVALRLTLDAGSVLEDDDQIGLAHFTEHMAFNGTHHFAKQELVDYIESIGMRFGPHLNASTSFDETIYMLEVPSDSTQQLETALQIFADWAQGISFEEEEIDKERGVVIEELRLRRDAGQRIFEQQVPVLLKDSRYADRWIGGNPTSIDTFHHAAVRRFYRDWYRPDLMGFVAVGDVEPAYLESLIVAYLGRVAPPEGEVRERTYYPVPDHAETLFSIVTDPEATSNQIAIYDKRDVRDESTVGAYRRSLMESLYHGMLNRRFQELVQQPQPPFLGAWSGQGRWLRTKEFFRVGAVVENNGFRQGLTALLTEMARVRQHGFTATELARQKRTMLRSMEQLFRERDKTPSRRFASEYVRHLLQGEPIPGIEKEYELYQDLLPSISLGEVNALVQQGTGGPNRVITVEAPAKEGVGVPTEAELAALFDTLRGLDVDAYVDDATDLPLLPRQPVPGTVVERDRIDTLGLTRWRLSNGVRVLLKPTDFKNDEIRFTAYSPGGHSLARDADVTAAQTATSVVTQGGVGNYDLISLRKWLSGKVVNVNPYIGELEEGLSGSASPEDLPTLFEMIYGYVTAPRADSAAYQSFLTRLGSWVENRGADPQQVFGDTIKVTMAQHHDRARPWSEQMLEEMDLQRSLSFYRDRFADAGDFTFIFVGNFTLEGIEPLVTTYLGGLPSSGRQESWRDVGIEPPAGVVEKQVRMGVDPKSQIRIVFTGPFDFDVRPDRYHLAMMASAFQIKLREVLREDLGGTYGVSVGAQSIHYPDEAYQLTISFGCDPDRVEELTDVVFTQIDSLRDTGLGQLYIDKVKEQRRRQREVSMKENGWWLSMLEYVDSHGLDPVILLDESIAASLTTQDVQRAAQRWFDTGRYARFVLLPGAAPDTVPDAAPGGS